MDKKLVRIFGPTLFLLAVPFTSLFAYVDPGSGFVFFQGTSFLWAVILGLLGGLFFLLKVFFRFFKKFFFILLGLLLILIISTIITGVIMDKSVTKKKVIILGIDAMDAKLTGKLIQDGRLPNFADLEKTGTFSALSSTNPSESAVAWTSFMTGLNPAGQGIFDFIMRNPKNYFPYLTLSETTGPRAAKIVSRRKGKTFWNILSENKIPAFIYFCPNTFPPERVYGKMTSGMGVPDITGTMGKFSFYTTKPLSEADKESRGRVISIDKGDMVATHLYGPRVNIDGSETESSITLKISKVAAQEVLLEFQGRKIYLKISQWSPWQRLSFKIGLFKKAYGIARFYLKSVEPDLELYCTPINFDPANPLFPISYPKGYSRKLSQTIGLFYTQGMPHDTWALSEGRLDEKAFLELTDEILRENKLILNEGLKEFKTGVFFYYFETLDAIQHMFWRYIDPKSPLYEANSDYHDTIAKYYEKIDQILGNILKKVDADTTLIVISDHGFGPFRRSAHLNRWLLENGYLALTDGKKEGRELFEDVNWSQTKAYALGFGGIYINRRGREGQGIVNENQADQLKRQIREQLKQWQDTVTGENVVKEVYDANDIFNGPYKKDGPDLFVGFNSGYRASWQTALGGAPNILIEDNLKKWSGDHLVDPSLVPGVIFINKKIKLDKPNIADVARVVLTILLPGG